MYGEYEAINGAIANALIVERDQLKSEVNALRDALKGMNHPCPRPINTATDSGMKWCQGNGHCGCVAIDKLRQQYGEALYPRND